jgi:pimeloyl-ACP methyl ester carboxylesterase
MTIGSTGPRLIQGAAGEGTDLKRAAVGDVDLEYEVSGTGDPLVFIHGAFIADSFRPLLNEPRLANYSLITYHRQGYGASSRTVGPMTGQAQAADCRALLQYLGVQRAHVVGHSFGGCIALQLALDAPELVHSLVLLEPALMVGASAPAYRESLLQSARRYRTEGPQLVMEEFFRARWPSYTRAALESVLLGGFQQALADTPATFELDIGLVDWTFTEAEARRIRQPALVVLGADSPKLHPRFEETYQNLLSWLPNAEGFVLPEATHFLQLETPQASAGLAVAMADFYGHHPLASAEQSAGGVP